MFCIDLRTRKRCCYHRRSGQVSQSNFILEQKRFSLTFLVFIKTGDECFGSGIGTIHALIMRSLGFGFEHLRLDRDDYITVHLDRMFGHAMRERFKPDVEPVLDYDYGSVLHLASDAFAKDDAGGPTLEAKRALPAGIVMGQRNGLSPGDVAKIRFIYNCSNAYPVV